jgi:GTPase
MKAGIVAVIGRPNVGKSTLVNALVGAKVSIVSPKPQTTRDAIRGILTRPDGQIVFVDSPGLHVPREALGRRMIREIDRATEGCDCVLLVVDATREIGPGDRAAIERVAGIRAPVFLVLNKVDRLRDKSALFGRIERYGELREFDEFVPVSAQRGVQLDKLVDLILARLPEGAPFYPEDEFTDQPSRFLVAELIRERVLAETHEEVPHSTAVLIEKWEETPRLLRIAATVYVERAGQKAILLGKGGEMMKLIGTEARHSIEDSLGRKVFLEIFVKVTEKWRDKPSFMLELDRFRRGVQPNEASPEDEGVAARLEAGEPDPLA